MINNRAIPTSTHTSNLNLLDPLGKLECAQPHDGKSAGVLGTSYQVGKRVREGFELGSAAKSEAESDGSASGVVALGGLRADWQAVGCPGRMAGEKWWRG